MKKNEIFIENRKFFLNIEILTKTRIFGQNCEKSKFSSKIKNLLEIPKKMIVFKFCEKILYSRDI